jgi:hypothetical protein
MMSRTGAEFRVAAAQRGITSWPIHNCSICGYPCGYRFDRRGGVWYDGGCHCVGESRVQDSSWNAVAEHYNRQTSPDVVRRYDEFWGFDSATPSTGRAHE